MLVRPSDRLGGEGLDASRKMNRIGRWACLSAVVCALGCLDFEESRFRGVTLSPRDAGPGLDPRDAESDAPACVGQPSGCTRPGQTVCDGTSVRTCAPDLEGCLAFLATSNDCAAKGEYCVESPGGAAACARSPCADGQSFYCVDPITRPQRVGSCDAPGSTGVSSTCEGDRRCEPSAPDGCAEDSPACRQASEADRVCDEGGAGPPFARVECRRRPGAATLEAIALPCDKDTVCVGGACEPHECDAVGLSCVPADGPYAYQECAEDPATGRRILQAPRDCAPGALCEGGACIPDPESCQTFSAGGRQCAAEATRGIQTCRDVGAGRLVWDPPVACKAGEECAGSPGAALCQARDPKCPLEPCTRGDWQSDRVRCAVSAGTTFESCESVGMGLGQACYQWTPVSGASCPPSPGGALENRGCRDAGRGVFCESGLCKELNCSNTCTLTTECVPIP